MAVLGFFMPPETGEKINMCITTMLSMGVYLQVVIIFQREMLRHSFCIDYFFSNFSSMVNA